MYLDPEYQIEGVTADPKSTRPQLRHAWLDGEDLVACDGSMLVVLKPDFKGCEGLDTDGPVPAEAIKASRKPKNDGLKGHIIANGSVKVPGLGQEFARPVVDGPMPPWKKILEDKAPVTFEVALDAYKLLQIAKAIGCGKRSIKLSFTSDVRAIRVAPNNSYGDQFKAALLMPCSVQEDTTGKPAWKRTTA